MSTFTYKDEVDLNDLTEMHPNIFVLLTAFIHYCQNWNLPCRITSLMEEAAGRKTRSHAQGRAFDASVGGWPEFYIYKMRKDFNDKYEKIAAISKNDLKPRAVVYHRAILGHTPDGEPIYGAAHLHFQVKP